MHPILRGSLAGLVATGTMSLVVAGGRAAGLLRTPPPKHITSRIEQKLGIRHEMSALVFESSWLAAHVGYGTANGVLFTVIRRLLPRSDIASGLTFGGLLWAVSYLGLMPGLNLYPRPDDDTRERQGVMIAAHAVYGLALAFTDRLLGQRRAQS